MESPSVRTISHALILQITLATLVANGAVQWVVGQQEFHDTFSCLVCERAVCLDHHSGLYGPGTRGHWLGRALDLDQAHSAVSGNHELLVVAVSWDRDAGFLACLDERGSSCPNTSISARISLGYIVLRGLPSTETFLPSIVSSTSACRRALVAKVRAVLREALALAAWAAGERANVRSMLWRIMLAAAP